MDFLLILVILSSLIAADASLFRYNDAYNAKESIVLTWFGALAVFAIWMMAAVVLELDLDEQLELSIPLSIFLTHIVEFIYFLCRWPKIRLSMNREK